MVLFIKLLSAGFEMAQLQYMRNWNAANVLTVYTYLTVLKLKHFFCYFSVSFSQIYRSYTWMLLVSPKRRHHVVRPWLYFKGTVSWNRFRKCWQKFTELGLTKGRGWFLNFLEGSNDFKMLKVYFLRLMPVCVGLIMVSCLFLSVPPITSGV